MAKEARYLKQVVVYLEKKYGKDKAKSIIDDALLRYDELIKETVMVNVIIKIQYSSSRNLFY